MIIESTLSEDDKEWGRLGGCYLIALALQKMIPAGEFVGLRNKWWKHMPGPANTEHVYVEVSRMLFDVNGAETRDKVRSAIEEDCHDPEKCRELISLTLEDVESLAGYAGRPNTSDNQEQAARIAAHLREDVRPLV